MLFYRLVRSSEPDESDFLSWAEKGQPVPPGLSEEEEAPYYSVSVFDSLGAAVAQARAVGWKLGEYVAELDIPDDGSVPWVQEGSNLAHYGLYGTTAVDLKARARIPAVHIR